MADFADKASELQAAEIEASLAAAKKATGLARTGRCHNCDEEVEPEQIYCDGECAEEHEYILSRRRANGRR